MAHIQCSVQVLICTRHSINAVMIIGIHTCPSALALLGEPSISVIRCQKRNEPRATLNQRSPVLSLVGPSYLCSRINIFLPPEQFLDVLSWPKQAAFSVGEKCSDDTTKGHERWCLFCFLSTMLGAMPVGPARAGAQWGREPLG